MNKPLPSQEQILNYIKEHNGVTLKKVAEHFGQTVTIVHVNKDFAHMITHMLQFDGGIALNDEWNLVPLPKRVNRSFFHRLDRRVSTKKKRVKRVDRKETRDKIKTVTN